MTLTTRARLGILGLLTALSLPTGPAPARGGEADKGKADYPTLGTIERLDPRLDRLVPRDARVERLAEGFDWAEGPVWLKSKGFLLFSDVPLNTVYKWQEGDTSASVFLRPSGYTGKTPRGGEPGSNGLVLDPEGRLVLMQHGDRRVARLGDDGRFVTLADKYDGKRLNSPNDGVYSSKGDLYFTDPPYGLLGNNNDPAKELPFNGVYRLAKDGTLTLLTRDMTFPNGIALSPDEKTLYVANSDAKKAIWMAFEVKEDGNIGKGRVFADMTKWVGTRKGAARRDEGGRQGQPVRHGSRRRPDLRPGRYAPRHPGDRRGDRQLRLGRRRVHPLYHGRHVSRPNQAHHQGEGLLIATFQYYNNQGLPARAPGRRPGRRPPGNGSESAPLT